MGCVCVNFIRRCCQIIWTNPPPSSRVTKDRMVALVDGLSAPDVDELKSTLRDLEQSLR